MSTANKKNDAKPTSQAKPSNKPQPLKVTSLLTPISLVCAIAALAVSINNQQNASTLDAAFQNRIQTFQSTIEQQKSTLQQINQALTKQQQQLSESLVDSKSSINQINKNLLSLTKQKEGDNITWQLQRAAYMINLAQLALHWEKQIEPAIALLESADEMIKTLNQPVLIGVRQSLSNELTKLKSMPRIDTVGLLSKLSALNNELEALPLRRPVTGKVINDDATMSQTNTDQSTWRQGLNKSLELLSKIVIIRRSSDDFKPLLSSQEKMLLQQQLSLLLQQAQTAVLKQDASIYQFSLNQLSQLLKQHYDLTEQATKSYLLSLDELAKQPITTTAPKIGRSFEQLQKIINSQSTTTKTKKEPA